MSGLFDIVGALPGAGLGLRMALVAAFVIAVALVAERLGPFLGGMFASLPLYTGPIYLLLALEHDADYIAASTVGSLAITGATAVFVLGYCIAARSQGTLASLASAYAGWSVCALVVQSAHWTVIEALLFVVPIYAVSVPLARSYTRGIALRRLERGWLDLPLRAVLCSGLAGAVITASAYLPAQLTGVLSVMPILLTSLILVMHARIGGAAVAALLAHSLGGLVGMVIAFVLVNRLIPVLGVWPALGIGLATTVAWNIMLIVARSLANRRRASALRQGSPLPERHAHADLSGQAMPPERRSLPPPLPPASRPRP